MFLIRLSYKNKENCDKAEHTKRWNKLGISLQKSIRIQKATLVYTSELV